MADLGGGGGGGGGGFRVLQPPLPPKSSHTKCTTNTAMYNKHCGSSEQVIKPRSKLAVVKPEALHLFECQLHVLELY